MTAGTKTGTSGWTCRIRPGITEADLPRIFETFWRQDEAHTTRPGWVLPIAQKILATHAHASGQEHRRTRHDDPDHLAHAEIAVWVVVRVRTRQASPPQPDQPHKPITTHRFFQFKYGPWCSRGGMRRPREPSGFSFHDSSRDDLVRPARAIGNSGGLPPGAGLRAGFERLGRPSRRARRQHDIANTAAG